MVLERYRVATLGVIVTCLVAGVQTAQDPLPLTHGTEFNGAVSLLSKNLKFDGTIFVPSTVRRADAVIVIVNWGATQELIFDRRPWRRLAQTVTGALLHVRMTEMTAAPGPRTEGPFWDAGSGAGEGLLALLGRLGDEARHPEFARVPLVVFGFSAAGRFASSFAAWQPDRVIGFVRYHSPGRPLLTSIQRVPALLIAGEKDNPAPRDDTPNLWKAGRAAGAPWTIAIEPEAEHPMAAPVVARANDLMIPWITAVIRLRVPQLGRRLRPIDPQAGWLGNTDTLEVAPIETFLGSRANANWLPDAASASGWRTMVSRSK